jgi:hypothetical protein
VREEIRNSVVKKAHLAETSATMRLVCHQSLPADEPVIVPYALLAQAIPAYPS